MFVFIFLLGFGLLTLISREFKITERLALAMPIGLGITTFLMFVLDRTIHAITLSSVLITLVASSVLVYGLRLAIDYRNNDLPWKRPRPKLDWSWLTLPWLVIAGMVGYLVWGITTKCLYWPPAEFDTIEGYDLLSKAIAREHILANSILTNREMVLGCGPRLLYPPLLALANSLCYMTGMESPKLINSLLFVSWVFIFYLLLRRFVNSTSAIFFTLLVVVVPEMYAHASFSLTNLPCAIYSSTAVISFIIWYEQRREGFFYLSLIAMLCSIWTRSEVVMLIGGILLVLAYVAVRDKRYKYLPIYATTLIPFFVWNAFLKALVPRQQTEFFVKHLFYDGKKLGDVLSTAWSIMSSSNIYGVTFYLFIFALVINVTAIWKRDKLVFLFIFFLALGAYTGLFYQMNNADGTLFEPGGWLQSGYKRGLFCYAPLALFYVASSKWVSFAFDKVHEQLVLMRR